MNLSQGVLSALQLSSPGIEQMVHLLRGAGALGAKLTGAGGDGGAVIGLFLEPEPGATARHPYLHKGLGPKRVDPFAGMTPP